jgi:hypothetical protein
MSLSDAVYDQHVFDGGPPLRLQRSLGLVKPEQPRRLKRALFAATISWAPLAIATAAQTLLRHDGSVPGHSRQSDQDVVLDFFLRFLYLFVAYHGTLSPTTKSTRFSDCDHSLNINKV